MEWYLLVALLMALVGIVLLALEFFAPTGGIAVVAAVATFAGAVSIVFLYGSQWEGLLSVVALCLGTPLAGYVLFLGYKRLALDPKLANMPTAEAAADELGLQKLDDLLDSFGTTLSPMRPSGIVELDGRRIDAVTEGRMLEAGVPIRCVAVRGTTIVVRPYEPIPDQPVNSQTEPT